MEKGKLVGAVRHAIALLRVLAASDRPLGVNQAARGAGVNPSTAFNVLRTMVEDGLVSFDGRTKTYRIGLGILQIAAAHEARDVIDVLRPELVRVATNYECLVALWRFAGERAILVERALADTPVRLDIKVTERMPCMAGAVGRAYAAARGWDDDALRAGFSALRWSDPMPYSTYRDEVAAAGAVGYGVDRDRLHVGVCSVGAVVVDRDGAPFLGVSALVVSGGRSAAALDRIGGDLVEVCGAIQGLPAMAA